MEDPIEWDTGIVRWNGGVQLACLLHLQTLDVSINTRREHC